MKKLLIGGITLALVLSGCTTTEPAPAVTVTETATSAPSTNNSNNSSSSTNVRDEFVMYLGVVDTPSYMLYGESLDILIGQAKDVCSYIAEGDSPDDILWIITLAAESSNADDEIVNAFVAASVAATYTYCPQYEGFWD